MDSSYETLLKHFPLSNVLEYAVERAKLLALDYSEPEVPESQRTTIPLSTETVFVIPTMLEAGFR